MTRDGILNAQLLSAIAHCGHTQTLVICDAGLPLPPGVPVIDLALVRGVPTFLEALKAVAGQLVVELRPGDAPGQSRRAVPNAGYPPGASFHPNAPRGI